MTTTPARQELGAQDPRTLGGFRLLYRTAEPTPPGTPSTPGVAAAGQAEAGDGTPATDGTAPVGPTRAVPEGVRTYLARSPRDHRTVELTAPRPDRAGDARLRAWLAQEARAATAVACRWTAPVVDADPDAAVPWLARAHCPALPLALVVETWGPLPEPTVRLLGAALTEAALALRQAELSHPELAPPMVTLAADGPRLVGLGHTRPAGEERADVQRLAETLAYAATGAHGAEARDRLAPPLAAVLGPALAVSAAPFGLAELRAAWGGPELTAEGTVLPLPGRAVALLAERASAALAAEPPGGDDGNDPDRPSGGERKGDHPTCRLRAVDTPTTRLRPVPAEALTPRERPATAAVPTQASPPHAPVATASDAAPHAAPAHATPPDTPPDSPPPDTVEQRHPERTHQPASAESDATTSTAPRDRQFATAPAGPSRRGLLGLVGLGTAGVLAGGGAVAGWVTGRGGARALVDPSTSGGRRATGTRRTPPGTPPAALWSYDVPVHVGTNSPLLWRDRVAVLIGQHGTVGLHPGTGREIWARYDLSSSKPGHPIGDGLAMVSSPGRFVAFDGRTGKNRWVDQNFFVRGPDQKGRHESDLSFEEDAGLLTVTDDGRTLFFVGRVREYPVPAGVTEYYLVAYDTRRRRERWRAPLPAAYSDQVHVQTLRDTVVLLGERDEVGEATAYRLTDGRKLWHRALTEVKEADRVSYALPAETLFGTRGGEVWAVELRTGRQRWRAPLAASPNAALRHGVLRAAPAGRPSGDVGRKRRRGRIYYVSDDEGNVYAVDADSGAERWRTALPAITDQGAALTLETSGSGRTLLAAGIAGVSALDARTGATLWHVRHTRHDPLEPYGLHPVGEVVLVLHNEVAFALPVA